MGKTALVLGEQLGADNPALVGADRILLIESTGAMRKRRYHRARLHIVLSAMRHRAADFRAEGREVVEVRRAAAFEPELAGMGDLVCMEPENPKWAARLASLGVELLPSNAFLADTQDFNDWATGKKRVTMEHFYRGMRKTHGLLLDSTGGPEGGKWNLDAENRRPPAKGLTAPDSWMPTEDEVDADVRRDLDALVSDGLQTWGADGPREFAVTAAEAEAALSDFLSNRLPEFGPWQDAMVTGERTLFHARLSVPLNLGLLNPLDVVQRVEAEYRAGRVPLQSAEGFIRQVIGWREFVRGMYRFRSEEWESDNGLEAKTPLPAVFYGSGRTDWNCLQDTIDTVRDTGYAHHIERLMVLGNSMLLLGVKPDEALDWFRESFVDAADWVMAPNVIGMGIHADGGVMMTKPYAAGGNYMSKMSQHCKGCRYDPKKRVGEDACPLTAMYWSFLARNREKFAGNHRMALALKNLDRISPDDMLGIQEVASRASAGLKGA
ncbi:MAG: cryptochrome/photolyase family protein [Solirubrobacterales bacterium]|nr:cryptochrome/photolyase family protein [Solirubrobacterales bacterium]